MKKKKMILILVLLLTIGFASISTTLVINGVIGISNKKDDFKVIFTEAILDGVKSNYLIDEETKEAINYETRRLTAINETTILDYKVTNTSKLYNASVSITCNVVDGEGNETTSDYIELNQIPSIMTINAGETKSGSVTAKLIKVSAEEQNIKVKCELSANATEREDLGTEYKEEEYKEVLLNGTDPVIKDGLIPVTIENDGTVKKADITSEWYSYENKRWANAVILSDESISYGVDEVIPEENIESYFVWIPKYKYKIWDLGNYSSATNGKPTVSKAQEIEIVFGTSNTEDVEGESCATPMTSGASGNCKIGDYMTPPAFISMGTNGLWVGKFETTGSTSNVTIKPNVTSLRSLNVKTMFDVSYNYKRELDSHMMKNTEWGSVAYLSLSKYGINKEVNINNNSSMITGYSAVEGTDQSSVPGTYGTDSTKTLPYNTETGYLASTTGNITGIYDMSGGANEYMASYMSGQIGASGFSDVTNANYVKYLDVYSALSNSTTYQYRILGDATGEMGPFYNYVESDGKSRPHNSWYADRSFFVGPSGPWFYRGGTYGDGVLTGQLLFNGHTGGSNGSIGFRLVLA